MFGRYKYILGKNCPKCGEGLTFKPVPSGLSVVCSDCKFKGNAKVSEISPGLKRKLLLEWRMDISGMRNAYYPGEHRSKGGINGDDSI